MTFALDLAERIHGMQFEQFDGAGKQRGGAVGMVALRYRGTGPAVLSIAGEGTVVAPYGARGGSDGVRHERSRTLVKRDVAYGYITRETAKRAYGFED